MSTVQRVAKNTTVLLAAQIASYLLAFFYMMYTARYLGATGFGILSFALAFTGIFAVFGDLGLRPLTVREVARDKSLAQKYLANVSLMKIILVAVTFGLIALTINLMGYPEEKIKVVYFLALFVIFQAFTQMFYSIFQAFERMEFQAIGQMLNAALILGGVIFVIKYGFSVVGFASLYAIASAIVLVYSFAVMKLKFSNLALASPAKAIEFDWGFWRPTLKEALPFGLTMFFATIFYWIDTVMLSFMKGDAVVGWYNAAYRMVLVLLFIPAAWDSAIFPVMSKFYITSLDSLRLSFEKSVKYLTMLGIPIGLGTTLLAQRFILQIFGTEYMPSVIALQILIWSVVITYVCGSVGTLLQTTNNQVVFAKIVGVCTFISVVLNLIFIPKYSYIAASIIAVLTTLISVILQCIASLQIGLNLISRKFLSSLGKVVFASILMGISINYLRNMTLILLIPLAASIYFITIFILRFFNKEDILIIRQLINKE
ncbi:MAG TPA: flippase [Dehalococcoidia bacterium]|nr:flippase [Dehalococcoidia bacterium]